MLLISIKTLQDDRFLRPLQNIGGLFFEDSTIGFEQEEANLIVDIHIEENVKASARLTDVATGNVYEETFAKDLSAFTDEKERMKHETELQAAKDKAAMEREQLKARTALKNKTSAGV